MRKRATLTQIRLLRSTQLDSLQIHNGAHRILEASESQMKNDSGMRQRFQRESNTNQEKKKHKKNVTYQLCRDFYLHAKCKRKNEKKKIVMTKKKKTERKKKLKWKKTAFA